MTRPRDEDPRKGRLATGGTPLPNPEEVNEFHRYDDLDNSPESHHHTLGIDPNQSSPGDHTHDGKNSKFLAATSHTHAPPPKSYVKAHLLANQTPANATWTKMAFATTTHDTDNEFDDANNLFTAKQAGVYQVSVSYLVTSGAAGERFILDIKHDSLTLTPGTGLRVFDYKTAAAESIQVGGSVVVDLAVGANILISTYHSTGRAITSANNLTYLLIARVVDY